MIDLCGRAAFVPKASATSIVASYACSFRLRRFASPLEKQSRLWRPGNSNQRFECDRLVRGRNSRHWRESTHLPPAPTPKSSIKIRVEGVCDKAFHSFDFINLGKMLLWFYEDSRYQCAGGESLSGCPQRFSYPGSWHEASLPSGSLATPWAGKEPFPMQSAFVPCRCPSIHVLPIIG